MKKKPEVAAFNMPLADMLLMAETKLAFARRDQEAFAARGVKAEHLTEIEDQLKAISKLPSDEELEQEVRGLEQKKNDLRASTTTLIQTALGKVNQVHHDESAEYRAFGARKLYDVGDPGFAMLCDQVSRVGQRELVDGEPEELEAYEAVGLTPAEFIAIGSEGDEFRRLMVDIRIATAEREVGTQKRLRLANPVYRALAQVSETGKSIFVSTDEARYNDYVIYDPEPDAAPAKPAMDAARESSGDHGMGAASGARSGMSGSGGTDDAANDSGTLSGRSSHMTDNTSTDTGGRTGGMASRGSGEGDPYTGAPTGL